MQLNFLSNSLKIFSGTTGPILKSFHRNVPWVTLLKNCLQNFNLSINIALVIGGFLHYTDMKKFSKNLLLQNCWSNFEIILKECFLGDPFKKLFAKFLSIHNDGSSECRFFALYGHERILKKSSSSKPPVRNVP